MKKRLNEKLNEKGMTLIELIIVVAILAIIAAVAIPNLVSSINDSRKSADVATGKIIADASARVLAGEGKYSGYTIAGLDMSTLTETANLADSDYDDDFQADLFMMMNKGIPVPKYSGTSIDEENYIVVVGSDRTVKVYIGDGVDISSGNALILYPGPSSEYTD